MHIDVVSQAILISFATTLNKTVRGFLALDAGKTTLHIEVCIHWAPTYPITLSHICIMTKAIKYDKSQKYGFWYR